MTIRELKSQVDTTIEKLKNHGQFPKENDLYDYKLALNFYGQADPVDIFLRNFAKDIVSFSNGNGGIILLGINEDKLTGKLEDIGLDQNNLELLQKIDLNLISQKFEKMLKVGVGIDLQSFQSGTRIFYYLLIEKQNQVLVPINDFNDYGLKKGEIIYRASGKNECANDTTQSFNRFLQIKANEKNKEFMEIWSKLLPEMFDINPREILIINPKRNKVYGFNGKDNILSSSDIEIDKSENQSGIFNVILSAISAGDIGKITDDEGKPLYKIIGEFTVPIPRQSIIMNTLQEEVNKRSIYKVSNVQLKEAIYYLGWVTTKTFEVNNPTESIVNKNFKRYTWIETFDEIKQTTKIVFSADAVDKVTEIINNEELHIPIFGRKLKQNENTHISSN